MRLVTILFLACALTCEANGQSTQEKTTVKVPKPPKITGGILDSSDRSSIYVSFDYPLPAIGEIPGAAEWLIYEQVQENKDTPPHMQKLDVDTVDTSRFARMHTAALKLKTPVADKAKSLEVMIVAGSYFLRLPPVTVSAEGDEPANRFKPSAGKSDSDIYFNGAFAATKGSSPIYDIDAFAGYMEGMQRGKTNYGEIGTYGQVRTKQSATLDPNSFQAYLVYQRVLSNSGHGYKQFQIPYINYRFAGLEFDLSGNQLNFVTSPVVTFPFRLSKAKGGALKPGFYIPQMVINLGPEFVYVEKSALATTGAWHTRGLMGMSFSSGYEAPEPKPLFASLQLISSYQVRIPSAAEIYYDPKFAKLNPATLKMVTPPMLGTQPRHFVDTTFSYNFVKWVAFTFENTYGSLPPAFNKTDATFNIGLSFTLKQSSFGRYAILRP